MNSETLLIDVHTAIQEWWRRVKYDKTKELLHFLAYIYSPDKISKLNFNK
jgi:hypothetical protein